MDKTCFEKSSSFEDCVSNHFCMSHFQEQLKLQLRPLKDSDLHDFIPTFPFAWSWAVVHVQFFSRAELCAVILLSVLDVAAFNTVNDILQPLTT